jgi:CRP-like cAMP-binding protein
VTTVEMVFFLRRVSIFSGLRGEDLAEVALLAEETEAGTGDVVIREGDVDDWLYVLVEGKVGVEKGGRRIAELGVGEVFGELAVLDPTPRAATVRALTDVTLLRIDGEAIGAMMRERPEISHGIARVLARRLRMAQVR